MQNQNQNSQCSYASWEQGCIRGAYGIQGLEESLLGIPWKILGTSHNTVGNPVLSRTCDWGPNMSMHIASGTEGILSSVLQIQTHAGTLCQLQAQNLHAVHQLLCVWSIGHLSLGVVQKTPIESLGWTFPTTCNPLTYTVAYANTLCWVILITSRGDTRRPWHRLLI